MAIELSELVSPREVSRDEIIEASKTLIDFIDRIARWSEFLNGLSDSVRLFTIDHTAYGRVHGYEEQVIERDTLQDVGLNLMAERYGVNFRQEPREKMVRSRVTGHFSKISIYQSDIHKFLFFKRVIVYSAEEKQNLVIWYALSSPQHPFDKPSPVSHN